MQNADKFRWLFKNDDHCNVKSEAISRDVENAHSKKVALTHKMKIDTSRTMTTTCSRVHKIWNQNSVNIRSRCVPESPNLESAVQCLEMGVRSEFTCLIEVATYIARLLPINSARPYNQSNTTSQNPRRRESIVDTVFAPSR
jgi:hypothetical protein